MSTFTKGCQRLNQGNKVHLGPSVWHWYMLISPRSAETERSEDPLVRCQETETSKLQSSRERWQSAVAGNELRNASSSRPKLKNLKGQQLRFWGNAISHVHFICFAYCSMISTLFSATCPIMSQYLPHVFLQDLHLQRGKKTAEKPLHTWMLMNDLHRCSALFLTWLWIPNVQSTLKLRTVSKESSLGYRCDTVISVPKLWIQQTHKILYLTWSVDSVSTHMSDYEWMWTGRAVGLGVVHRQSWAYKELGRPTILHDATQHDSTMSSPEKNETFLVGTSCDHYFCSKKYLSSCEACSELQQMATLNSDPDMFGIKPQFIWCDNGRIQELFAEVARQVSLPDFSISIHVTFKSAKLGSTTTVDATHLDKSRFTACCCWFYVPLYKYSMQ